MNIFINGQSFTLNEHSATVTHALAQFLTAQQQQSTFAVALNSEFVGKEQYPTTTLTANDSIDVLFPIQGG